MDPRTLVNGYEQIENASILLGMPTRCSFGRHPYYNEADWAREDASIGVTREHLAYTNIFWLGGPALENVLVDVKPHMTIFNKYHIDLKYVGEPKPKPKTIPTVEHILVPKPLVRQNFCQLRGSQLPAWFPGNLHYLLIH